MKIDVTESDIGMGVRGNRCYCPIAWALKRVFSTERVTVNYRLILINGEHYDVPSEVADFVRGYDNALREPKPFSFLLGKPLPEDPQDKPGTMKPCGNFKAQYVGTDYCVCLWAKDTHHTTP